MNKSQKNRIVGITNRIQKYYGRDGGNFCYKVTDLGLGRVQLSGSNAEGLRWFETHRMIVANIGPRGGVQWSSLSGITDEFVFTKGY